MTTETRISPDSATGLGGSGGPTLLDRGTRWRLPIPYRAIASTALAVDLALILISATLAQAIYHKVPDEFGGEFSRTVAAAIFVAILFVPAAAFAIANQVGNHAGSNVPMNVLAVILIAAGIGYIYIIVRH